MKEQKRSFAFCIPISLLQKLRYIAEHEYRSTSSMIRILVYDYVETFEREHGTIDLK